jgi:predicted glutamine amidotransferase
MCRLLGYCTRTAASLAEIMGEPGLREFTHLSTFHGDGWGMAWYDGSEPHVKKSPLRPTTSSRTSASATSAWFTSAGPRPACRSSRATRIRSAWATS